MPRIGDKDYWETLTEGTKKFAQFTLMPGEAREYYVHSGQSVMVRELTDTGETM